MNNWLSIVVAILEHIGALTEDEAKKLIKELHGTTLPDNYEAASKLVKELFANHEIKTIAKKLDVKK